MRAGRLDADIVCDEPGLRALEGPWRDLWRRCQPATPFQSPDWAIPWWRHFHPGRLATIAVRRADRLVGLAPFYLEEGSDRLMPVGVSLSDYLDVLIDPDGERETAAAIVEAALALPWREWSFEALAPDAAAWSLPTPPGCRETVFDQDVCPVLPLAGTGPYGDAVSAKKTRVLRQDGHRAARLGPVDLRRCDDAQTFLQALIALHSARWAGRGEAGVLADPRVQAFHAEALPILVAAGLARLHLLTIGGMPAGAQYSLGDGKRLYLYLNGFDPRFSSGSPGAVAMARAIADAKAEGCDEAHFLRGDEAYKYSWGATDRPNRRRVWARGL